jgi:hypothetical protein
MKHFKFDEESVAKIGRKYQTSVVMTDYDSRITVYKGPLCVRVFNWIRHYEDQGYLPGCKWTKRQTHVNHGWTKFVMQAVDQRGEEHFCVTVLVRARVSFMPKDEARTTDVSGLKACLAGMFLGLFPLDRLLEIVGGAAILNELVNHKNNEREKVNGYQG